MAESSKTLLFEVSLAVPARLEFDSMVKAVVDDATTRLELDEETRERVRKAAGDAFTLVVTQAMTESDQPVRLHFCETGDALHVSIRERGLPMDAKHAQSDPRWHELLRYTDRASWRWHGVSGTELHLIFEHMPERSHTRDPALVESVDRAPEQTYAIRRFRDEDAHGVVRAFYATYGYGYDVPVLYEPRRLCQLNAAERYVSFVALDESGEVVGHYALDLQPGAPIAEGCGAVVDPRHRGRHLLEQLRSAAEEHARSIGLAAYFTEPVTDHPITQVDSEKFGAKITAISLGFSPRTLVAKHMNLTATNQRQSLTLYVKPLRGVPTRTIYPPARHCDMLARIYELLEIPVQMRPGAACSGQGALQVAVVKPSQNATIVIERVGTDTADIARQATADLVTLGSVATIYAMLPLEDPGTPHMSDALERQGFFFSGLAPWMLNGKDALRLQRLLQPVDTAQLTIASDAGKRLLAYIDAARSP